MDAIILGIAEDQEARVFEGALCVIIFSGGIKPKVTFMKRPELPSWLDAHPAPAPGARMLIGTVSIVGEYLGTTTGMPTPTGEVGHA